MGKKIDLTHWVGYTGDMRNHEEKETYYTNWNNKDIIFHVAPLLSSEAIRRLIGNDIVIIVFTEDVDFNPYVLKQLGTVPLIFFIIFVVSPHTSTPLASSIPPSYPPTPFQKHPLATSSENIHFQKPPQASSSEKFHIEKPHNPENSPYYRLSFFKSSTLPSIEPPIPDEDLDVNQLRDLLFTKAFNGLI
eukprot:TRINITY_DN19378_c0_g1_i2.p1 TRINITY_DN19378_c0_g1~~TRINITY_DN19378_c0_g1_i2.p1  ORF type:complete len:190 (+),score=44.00 TRINITY_DN19378_c0_g1_i2:155-724(+)